MRINITESAFVNAGLAVLGDSNFSETAVNYIQDNYFNGADNAVTYIGYSMQDDNIIFEFELMPG